MLGPGDGKRLTEEEAKKAEAGGGQDATTTNGGGESAEAKAKREELLKKNAEIEASNKKAENTNQIVGDAFKAGNAALNAKNYEEAVKQYDIGLAADPEQGALLTNKAAALKALGVDKYNAAIKSTDDAGRTAQRVEQVELVGGGMRRRDLHDLLDSRSLLSLRPTDNAETQHE